MLATLPPLLFAAQLERWTLNLGTHRKSLLEKLLKRTRLLQQALFQTQLFLHQYQQHKSPQKLTGSKIFD